MKKSIKELLVRYSITSPGLLSDLNDLFEISMKASRELGKRSLEISQEETNKAWTEIRYAILSDFKSDYGLFGPADFERVKAKYKIYSKNNEIQSTRIDREANRKGYSMQPFLRPLVKENVCNLSVASINEFPLRKDVDG